MKDYKKIKTDPESLSLLIAKTVCNAKEIDLGLIIAAEIYAYVKREKKSEIDVFELMNILNTLVPKILKPEFKDDEVAVWSSTAVLNEFGARMIRANQDINEKDTKGEA